MIKFDEFEGVRYMVDEEDGHISCLALPPQTFANLEELKATISARNAMPLLEHKVFLGNAEQFQYTYQAKDIFDLKAQLATKFDSMKGEWEELKVSKGYPKGARKFQVRWRNDAYSPTPVLIIVREGVPS